MSWTADHIKRKAGDESTHAWNVQEQYCSAIVGQLQHAYGVLRQQTHEQANEYSQRVREPSARSAGHEPLARTNLRQHWQVGGSISSR